jgi:hypothetical protein
VLAGCCPPAQFGLVQAAGTDPPLGGLNEESADATRLQRAVDRQLPDCARIGGLGVVDPARWTLGAEERGNAIGCDLLRAVPVGEGDVDLPPG